MPSGITIKSYSSSRSNPVRCVCLYLRATFITIAVLAISAPILYAADIDFVATTDDGTDAFNFEDSGNTDLVKIDSDGNTVVIGGLRLDSGGTEHTVAEELIVDGKIGIKNITPTYDLDVTGEINATVGVIAADATFTHLGRLTQGDASFTDVNISGLTPSRCVETDANGFLSSDSAACNDVSADPWTDAGSFLHPSDSSGVEDIVLGGTTVATADVFLDAGVGGVTATQATFTNIGNKHLSRQCIPTDPLWVAKTHCPDFWQVCRVIYKRVVLWNGIRFF